MQKRVAFVAFEGFELLDLAGPSSVFSTANLFVPDAYELVVLASRASVTTRCGVSIRARKMDTFTLRRDDTVLVMGGYEAALVRASRDPMLRRMIERASKKAARYGSVCGGAFLLGALVNGQRVTTHWSATERLAQMFPAARVENDALYINEGRLWTSAGVSTGIDMALAMLEADLGRELMGRVAKQLVLYAHRPGAQSQFSALLEAQTSPDRALADVVRWLEGRRAQSTSVASMARRARLSERTFHRRFTAAFDKTPARFCADLRLDGARQHLEAGESIKRVAPLAGYASEAAFRSAFTERFGVPPSHYARMNRRRVAA